MRTAITCVVCIVLAGGHGRDDRSPCSACMHIPLQAMPHMLPGSWSFVGQLSLYLVRTCNHILGMQLIKWPTARSCVAAAGLLSSCCSSALSHSQDAQPCARAGYVFLECQQPQIESTHMFDRLLYVTIHGFSINQLQQRCQEKSACVAFSTNGLLFKASNATGKVGPFKSMNACQPHKAQNTSTSCRGTYVYDGGLTAQTEYMQAQNPLPVGPVVISAAYGNAQFIATDDGLTSVVAQLTAKYVRGKCCKGPGKIGKAQCSLC